MRPRNTTLLWLAAGAGAVALARQAIRKRRTLSLHGKTALITGGSRGLGFEIAKQLADAGVRVALCARDIEELKHAEDKLKRRGGDVFILPADIGDRDAAESIVHSVTERFGSLDILVNNAGIIGVGPLEDMQVEDFEKAMQIHYFGPLYLTLAALPGMRSRRSGRIVNIASIGGKISVPHMLPYCSSKFALVGFSEGLRAELQKDNIFVTTVCPGLMRTGGEKHAEFKSENSADQALFTFGATSPLTSIDVHTAARRIVEALKFGDAQVILSLQAKAIVLAHDLFPGVFADLSGVAARFLPQFSPTPQATGATIAPGILRALTGVPPHPTDE
ncbi:MAG: gno 2 [Chthonomonadaceae bacterium]|nr:gno 2 [Chthonomonadaceae bacterium]